MLRNRKAPIKIRVALDSIIYAPLYVFIQLNSLNRRSPFRFFVEPVHTGIDQVPREYLHSSLEKYRNLSSLRPIQKDPVFSPVCERRYFYDEPRTWFGVGDPLRAYRLKLYKNSTVAYQWVGTLVCRLAFWILAEEKCRITTNYLRNFNYVTCHSKGMTGYYITEALFRTPDNNPLAPVYAPGQEVEQIFAFLGQDWGRRLEDATDPVWGAAVTTEIGRILDLQRLHKKHPTEIHRLHERNHEKVPSDVLLTALVARSDEDNCQEIVESTEFLKCGLLDAISQLRQSPAEFCSLLASFYRSHASFALPGGARPFLLEAQMRDPRIAKELKDLYPDNQLVAPLISKLGTNWLLAQAIVHDAQEHTPDSTLFEVFEELKPDKWEADGQLWVN